MPVQNPTDILFFHTPASEKRGYTVLALSVLPSVLPSVTNIFRRAVFSNRASQPLQPWYDVSAMGHTFGLSNSDPPLIYFQFYDLIYFPTFRS